MIWERVLLSDVCSTVTKGTTPKTYGFEYTSSGVPFIRVNDFPEGRLELRKSTLFVAPSTHRKYKRSIINSGNVLLSIAGTIGRSCVVPDGLPEMNCNQAVCVIRVENEVLDASYLNYWLRSLDAKRQMANGQVTGVITNFNLTTARNLSVPLPPLAEQKRIAGILDAADALRAKRREALAQLDTLLQSTFLDMFGDPVTNPMGWEVKKVSDFCKTQTGGTPSRSKPGRYYGGDIPWVKSGELRERTVYDTDEHITQHAIDETAAKIVPPGALMVALYGATVGRIAVLGVEAATNQAICSIIVSPEKVNAQYMFYALRTKVPEWLSRRVGGGQPNISNGVIKDTLIALPPHKLQAKFAQAVSLCETQRQTQEAHLSELDALFASLQSRAFNGEL
ncbi:MAG: restriction endonuclease subunit S [Chloroflexi bacterium]|nr:restriction endonuclease subunit S [Chloroflexota bacterium]